MFLDSVLEYASSLNNDSDFCFSDEENAYVLNGNAETFICPSCREAVEYGECSCGVMWNVYHIHEGGAIKTIARTIDKDLMLQKIASKSENDLGFELL